MRNTTTAMRLIRKCIAVILFLLLLFVLVFVSLMSDKPEANTSDVAITASIITVGGTLFSLVIVFFIWFLVWMFED